jgi:3-deoxy-D-manno-octulosonate 8-phosphate phosphatase (KDO 8-P phosphatase)
MDYVYQGLLAKTQAYEEILKDCGYTPEQTAFIGDDFTDIPVMKRSGLAIAVKNARPEVIASSHHVTEVDGGAGAVREAVELILKAQGLWSKILNQYEISQL